MTRYLLSVFLSPLLGVFVPMNGVAAQGNLNELRDAAPMLAKIEDAMKKRDLKAYCAATYGASEYVAYASRACQFEVKHKLKTAPDCAPDKMKTRIEAERGKCLAMSSSAFDQTIRKQTEGIAAWKKNVAAEGGNPDKLLADARAESGKK